MKRRTFVKTVLGAIGAFGVGKKVIDSIPDKPKINPAWINAPYELRSDVRFDPQNWSGEWQWMQCNYHPPRDSVNNVTGQYERVQDV